MGKRIACLITGVPRGYERCLPTLIFLLGEWDVTYYAVIREEFAMEEVVHGLKKEIPSVQTIVIPRAHTAAAIKPFEDSDVATTLVKMWHEIWYGANAIPDKDSFDFIFRTRFDIFFHEQYLPEVQGATDTDAWIPEQLSWAGSNDMLCLAPPSAFEKYARTYEELHNVVAHVSGVPEGILCRAMALTGIVERKLDVFFILYRDALFSSFDNAQLNTLAHIHPALSIYKLGGEGDTEEARDSCVETVEMITKLESQFPLFTPSSVGDNFYPPESDIRDGSTFRWMPKYAKIRRTLRTTTYGMQFKINYCVQGWEIQHLCILIDGNLVKLEITGHDEFGRLQVSGRIDRIRPFRRPWSNITFSSSVVVVPAAMGENNEDHRALSVAISNVQFMERSNRKNESAWTKTFTPVINSFKRWVSDITVSREIYDDAAECVVSPKANAAFSLYGEASA